MFEPDTIFAVLLCLIVIAIGIMVLSGAVYILIHG